MSFKVLVTGVFAIDEIRNEFESRVGLLGGSVPFAAMSAASFTEGVGIYGVVGDDFPKEYKDSMEDWGIHTKGLETVSGGKTFRWGGEYAPGMDERETFLRELNVLEGWTPCLGGLKETDILVLASATGKIHLSLLNEYKDRGIAIADTMDYWIIQEREETDEVLRRADIFTLNESEAYLYSGADNLEDAAEFLLKKGARFLVIKRGSQGAVVYEGTNENFFDEEEMDENYFALIEEEVPVCPLTTERVIDPTGAGDSFLGGIAGYLASREISKEDLCFDDVVEAVEYGTVVASLVCEGFSVEALLKAGKKGVQERLRLFQARKM